ncbi:MAG: ATP synthase subunit I [Clostridia bacterium]|nr:ATP synthase subunit I [Clostridia bacterium]
MAKLDPVIRKETAYVTLWVLATCALMQGVCLIAGWWSIPVLLGSLLGGLTAVGNFLLMCLMVQKAVTQDEKQAKNTVKLSQSLRLMMQGLVLVLAAVIPVFNIWTAAIPLLIPRIAISLRELRNAKKHPSPDRPAIGWDNDEDDDD